MWTSNNVAPYAILASDDRLIACVWKSTLAAQWVTWLAACDSYFITIVMFSIYADKDRISICPADEAYIVTLGTYRYIK